MSAKSSDQSERAIHVIAELRQKLAEAVAARPQPIAVVGMACRFPGAPDCDAYWRMIEAGRNAVREVPGWRYGPAGADPAGPSRAALLDDIKGFDASFFDISPREAVQMDPQQRLFLEVAWEALEDAGQSRAGLAGSRTGVFVGVHNHSSGYFELQAAEQRLNEFTGVGSGHDVIAGRLSYFLDLRGPNAVVNTACSSSLVAVHLACRSLNAGDCSAAIASGVNLILGSMQGRIAGLGGMLAADGRCKTFDAAANGYGRGEGCGVLVLKRLGDAERDRDRVLAVIRGTAVNQDGRSNGLTAPNGLAQQALLRQALANAGLDGGSVGYIEAHGTGTALGDPIEVEALAEIYGNPSGAGPCALGSAKANINHLEGAAGIAGVIKAVLALRACTIPPVAGFERPNPHLRLENTRLFIPTKAMPWAASDTRIAGVSAFGWSGVNAHLLIAEPPAAARHCRPRPTIVTVSTHDPRVLAERALGIAQSLDQADDGEVESFAWTTAARRSHYPTRIAAVGRTRAELAAALRRKAQAAGEHPAGASSTLHFASAYPALEAQLAELKADEPIFAAAVDECTQALRTAGTESAGARFRLFAFHYATAALLRHWGARPAAFTGDGAGAIAAAACNGEMSLRQALEALADPSRPPPHAARPTPIGLGPDGEPASGPGAARCAMLTLLAEFYAAGGNPRWDRVFAADAGLVSLPAYPFRRRPYWLGERAPETAMAAGASAVPAEWLFQASWRVAPAADAGPPEAPAGSWLILDDGAGLADAFAGQVRRGGGSALVWDAGGWTATAMPPDVSAVIDLRPTGIAGEATADAALAIVGRTIELEQAIVAHAPAARLWIVTRGAQAVASGERPALAAAPLWGWGRSRKLAEPARWSGLIDLDPAGSPREAELLYRAIARTGDEFQIALRGGQFFIARLTALEKFGSAAPRLDPDAAYLVTGAFGGIGPSLAHWLADRGARHLVLVGRSIGNAPDDRHPARELARTLRARGIEAELAACDVGDAAQLRALFRRIRQGAAPLRGLFHAAAGGIEATAEATAENLAAAFRAKVQGTLLLHEESSDLPLDHFVLFSSAAAVLGNRERAHYAAANAFMDAFASHRRARSLPALSVNWGLWGGREDTSPEVRFFIRSGLAPMAPETALAALGSLLGECAHGKGPDRPLVARLDLARLHDALDLCGRGQLLGDLMPQPKLPAAAGRFAESLASAGAGRRHDRLVALIAAEVRETLELDPDDPLDTERGFFDLGMDSLMTVDLKARLEDGFGIGVPSTLTLDFPSVAALARYFEDLLDGGRGGGEVADAARGAPEIAGAITEMSDMDVAAALNAELAELDAGPLA